MPNGQLSAAPLPGYSPIDVRSQLMYAPPGYQPYGPQSPVSTAIWGMGGGFYGGQRPAYGGQPGYGGAGYSVPGGQEMDPRFFGQLYAPQQLATQQYTQQQTGISEAIRRAQALMGGMGMPAEGGLGDLESWAQQRAGLEAEPIRRREGEALRSISDLWARKGSALGSEAERNIAEVRGASLAALRSSVIGAAIDAFMKRPQILAQLMAASR